MTPKQELLQELETTPLPIILQLLQFLRFLKAQNYPHRHSPRSLRL